MKASLARRTAATIAAAFAAFISVAPACGLAPEAEEQLRDLAGNDDLLFMALRGFHLAEAPELFPQYVQIREYNRRGDEVRRVEAEYEARVRLDGGHDIEPLRVVEDGEDITDDGSGELDRLLAIDGAGEGDEDAATDDSKRRGAIGVDDISELSPSDSIRQWNGVRLAAYRFATRNGNEMNGEIFVDPLDQVVRAMEVELRGIPVFFGSPQARIFYSGSGSQWRTDRMEIEYRTGIVRRRTVHVEMHFAEMPTP